MRSFTHLAFSATVTSAFLCTSDPLLVAFGAAAGCLPDVDTKNSWTGRILRPVSYFVEQFGHRQITHSLLGSFFFGVSTVAAYFLLKYFDGSDAFWEMLAANIGYSSGWLLDAGSKTGVPIFYPLQKRLVFPFDPNFRLSTGTLSEKVFGLVVLCGLAGVLYINGAGGALSSFANLIGSSQSAVSNYREHANAFNVLVSVRGINQRTQEKFERENLRVIGTVNDSDLLVKISDDEILQVGESRDAHIKVSHLETTLGEARRLVVRSIQIPDETKLSSVLERIPDTAEVFGTLKVDEASSLNLRPNVDPLVFHRVTISQDTSGTASIEFRAARSVELQPLKELWITGNLLVKEKR